MLGGRVVDVDGCRWMRMDEDGWDGYGDRME